MKKNLFQKLKAVPQGANLKKISFAIVLLAVLELLLLAVVVLQNVLDGDDVFSVYRLPAVIALFLLVTFDVISAVHTTRDMRIYERNAAAAEESLKLVEQLNGTLRAQRHDFLNHLQVVYGLMEMNEFDEASDYIRRVSADIRDVSRVLRTRNAAVNALLQAKYAMCREKGVAFDMTIHTAMEELPIEDWQMCRILSNLIDNAVEAMGNNAPDTRMLRLFLEEDEIAFTFRVENNGPAVPRDFVSALFNAGASTKGEGRGMGLSIVRQVLKSAGGDIRYERSGDWTVFAGSIPKSDTSHPSLSD